MNSEIKIVDNFLEESDFNQLTSYSNDIKEWQLQKSNPNKEELDFLMSDITYDPFFSDYLYDKVVEQLDGDNYQLSRVYFNGQWNGREGNLHVDRCDFTALLYINPYEYGWGGFTEIMTKPEPTLVYPIQNRLMIFNGNLIHKGYSFAYQTCPLRISLAFKIHYSNGDLVGGWR